MKTIEFSAIEKEMANFNFSELNTHKEAAKANIASAQSVGDVTTGICSVWSKVRKYVILAENIPFIGKFITIIADLLDSLCPAS
jgi:hypothetical protein